MIQSIIKFESLENKLIKINDQLVLIDKDVANLYQVEPKKLRQQLKRNIEKFPNDYAYQLNEEEFEIMVSQNVTPSKKEFISLPCSCVGVYIWMCCHSMHSHAEHGNERK